MSYPRDRTADYPTAPPKARIAKEGAQEGCNNCAYYSWKTDPNEGAGKCFRDRYRGPGNTWWTWHDMVCDSWKQDPHPPDKETPPPPRRPATRDEILHVSGRTEERLHLPSGMTEVKCVHGVWPSERTCMPCQNASLLREARILQEESPVKQPKGTNKAIRKAARKAIDHLRQWDQGQCGLTPEIWANASMGLVDRLDAELAAHWNNKPKAPESKQQLQNMLGDLLHAYQNLDILLIEPVHRPAVDSCRAENGAVVGRVVSFFEKRKKP